MASIHAENILCPLTETPRGIQHGIALTPGVGITSMALSALVTHPDSAVQLIKRYTTIRPCQHHSHPQKELFAFLSLFLLLAEDTHIMEIRVVPRMRIENSECCPGSPPLASDNRSIECREPGPHSGHLPPLLSPLPDWAFTRSAVVPHAFPLSPAPLCLFSHNIRSIIGEIPLTALLTSRLNLAEIVRKVGGSPKTGRSSSRRAISEIAAAPPFCPTPVRLLINVSFALNIRQPWLHHPVIHSCFPLPSTTCLPGPGIENASGSFSLQLLSQSL